MPKVEREPFGFGKIFCPCCGKFLKEGETFNFFTNACAKCAKKIIECKFCGRKMGVKQRWKVRTVTKQSKAVCPLCEGCVTCCNCCHCRKCGVPIIGNDGFGELCWGCAIKTTGLTEAFRDTTPNKKPRLEQFLQKFYVLEHILGITEALLSNEMAMIKAKVDESELKNLKKMIRPLLDDVTNKTAGMYLNYLVGAVAGESRYLCKNSECAVGNGLCGGEDTRSAAIAAAKELDPKRLLMLMSVAFKSGFLGGSIGGPKWANIAATGLLYYNATKKIFLDNVVDLTHNGGLFLGKTSHFFDYDEGSYMGLLSMKKSGNPLATTMPLFADDELEKVVRTAADLKLVEMPATIVKGTLGVPREVEYGGKVPFLRKKHAHFLSKEEADAWLMKIDRESWSKLKDEFWDGIEVPKDLAIKIAFVTSMDHVVTEPANVWTVKGGTYVKVKA